MEWAGQLTGKMSDQMEPSQPAFIIHIIAIQTEQAIEQDRMLWNDRIFRNLGEKKKTNMAAVNMSKLR